MSLIDNNSNGGSPWQLPRRPLAISQQSADASTSSNMADNLLSYMGLSRSGSNSPQNKSLLDQWGQNSLIWGGREVAASAVNNVVTPDSRAGKALSEAQEHIFKKFKPNAEAATFDAKPLPQTYSKLLHLGNDQVPLEKLSASTFSQTVDSNLKTFKDATQPTKAGNFFKGVTAKNYVNDTVIERNIRPIKDLISNSPDKQVGTGIFQGAALGLMGYDVVKHTSDAYKHAKAKEDGSFTSKLNTYKETTVAFGKYAFRDGTSWEAAGVGAAIGRAIIPIALGPVSLGGIAIGAAVGLGAQKVMNHVLKTGEQDPIQQAKTQGKLA